MQIMKITVCFWKKCLIDSIKLTFIIVIIPLMIYFANSSRRLIIFLAENGGEVKSQPKHPVRRLPTH